jgi:hypothetical protein
MNDLKGQFSVKNCKISFAESNTHGIENCFLVIAEDQTPYLLSAASSQDRDEW